MAPLISFLPALWRPLSLSADRQSECMLALARWSVAVALQITLDLGAIVVVARGNNGHRGGVEWSRQVGTVHQLARSLARWPGWFSSRGASGGGGAGDVRSVRPRHSLGMFRYSRDVKEVGRVYRHGFRFAQGFRYFLFVLFGQNNILILIVCLRRGDYFV